MRYIVRSASYWEMEKTFLEENPGTDGRRLDRDLVIEHHLNNSIAGNETLISADITSSMVTLILAAPDD